MIPEELVVSSLCLFPHLSGQKKKNGGNSKTPFHGDYQERPVTTRTLKAQLVQLAQGHLALNLTTDKQQSEQSRKSLV
jgi:hypothetical protein